MAERYTACEDALYEFVCDWEEKDYQCRISTHGRRDHRLSHLTQRPKHTRSMSSRGPATTTVDDGINTAPKQPDLQRRAKRPSREGDAPRPAKRLSVEEDGPLPGLLPSHSLWVSRSARLRIASLLLPDGDVADGDDDDDAPVRATSEAAAPRWDVREGRVRPLPPGH